MNKGRLRQCHAAMAGGFGSLVMGALNVWPSYTSELYASNTTTPLSAPMTKGEEALLGSLPSLGAILGSAVAGTLINMFGRRNGGVILSLPCVMSWAIIGVASSMNLILAARFLSGITGGSFLVLSPIFISEVAEDAIRGGLASASIFLYCMGTLLSYIVGWCLTYRTIIWLHLLLSVLCTLLILLVVESPVYLLRQKREEDAREAIAKYRGVPVSSMVVLDELTRMKQQIMPAVELVSITDMDPKAEEAEKQKLNNEEEIIQEQPKSMSPIKLLFVSPVSRQAFIVVMTVITMQVFMGIVPVQVYAKTVFTETDPSKSDLYTVMFAVIQFFGALTSSLVADKAGRRILIIISSILVFLCLVSLGFLLQTRMAPAWLTVVLLMMYCFSFLIGAGSIPYVLLAEVFESQVQGLGSMIIIEWVWFLNFFILGIFPYMLSALKIHGAFYFFGAMSLINAILAFILVPETKGLSNAQIQDLFRSRKKN
ncbi:facilitated trehalose transporter Tret1-2 homolog [Helicoverpa zea]|uniref:facilitated trehalose transporter Tret1-2 homolog n=1 Tax=Helicoverpa zea TaxID=7113 RepID=UPI001F596F81|nr:facilitated trehalose transporter Tret1-2 homolog [Helicoverpa zea]